MKTVYQTDVDGYLIGEATAHPDPMDEGAYLVPAGCADIQPPTLLEGQRARWTGQAWVVVSIPAPPPPPAPPAPTDEDLAAAARRRRDILLRGCDFTQLPDAPGDRVAWAGYRKKLRDLPSQPGWPRSITWPTPPAS